MVFATQCGGRHAADGHAGCLRKKVAEAEVVNVPSRHVVVDVEGRPSCVVHHKADLHILIDVVVQINGNRGPSRRVLSGR